MLTWVGWPKGKKLAFDLGANLISTKVSTNHHKSTQVHASPGQTKSQVSFQLTFTCDSVWPGLKGRTIFRLRIIFSQPIACGQHLAPLACCCTGIFFLEIAQLPSLKTLIMECWSKSDNWLFLFRRWWVQCLYLCLWRQRQLSEYSWILYLYLWIWTYWKWKNLHW